MGSKYGWLWHRTGWLDLTGTGDSTERLRSLSLVEMSTHEKCIKSHRQWAKLGEGGALISSINVERLLQTCLAKKSIIIMTFQENKRHKVQSVPWSCVLLRYKLFNGIWSWQLWSHTIYPVYVSECKMGTKQRLLSHYQRVNMDRSGEAA